MLIVQPIEYLGQETMGFIPKLAFSLKTFCSHSELYSITLR